MPTGGERAHGPAEMAFTRMLPGRGPGEVAHIDSRADLATAMML